MRSLAALSLSCALTAHGTPALAETPHIVVSHLAWKSHSGRCEADVQTARVAGVAPAVAAVIDAALDKMQRGVVPSTLAAREAACAANVRDANAVDDKATFYDGSDWTLGVATGRWLAARLHVTHGSSVQAHPSDAYEAVTFDLAHGGYPVPTRGFYPPSKRARFDAAVYAADLAAMRVLAKSDPGIEVDPVALRENDLALTVSAEQIFVKANGIELSGTQEAEAARNYLFAISNASLFSLGTPNGPLDPHTR